MSFLLSLCPPEVMHNILREVETDDLANLAKCCKLLNHFIQSDRLLWKEHYLRDFDHPDPEKQDVDSSWQVELQKIVTLRKLLSTSNTDVKRSNREFVTTTALDLLQKASAAESTSMNIAFLTQQFDSQANINAFLCSSSLFERAALKDRIPALTESERQLSAKLHVHYGISVEYPGSGLVIHPYARARVYDLRRYTDGNFWGPFKNDGSQDVDWEKVEALMVVLGYNLRVFNQRTEGRLEPLWDRKKPFTGTGARSFVSPPPLKEDALESISGPTITLEPHIPLEAQDPYGITGTWMRVVCFLDYTDLYAINFERNSLPNDQDLDPLDTREALRLITLRLRIDRIEPAGEDDGQDMPVVYFTGTSRSMYMSWDPNANSKIRGMVRTTPSGAIRWTSFSIIQGEERWRSEGIQVGGIRSSRGIIGTWFDKDYDHHGPAGPTAFFKLSDDIVEEKPPMQALIAHWHD